MQIKNAGFLLKYSENKKKTKQTVKSTKNNRCVDRSLTGPESDWTGVWLDRSLTGPVSPGSVSVTFSFSNMAASSAKRRLPLPTPSFLARSLRFTWRGTERIMGSEPHMKLLSDLETASLLPS